MSLPLIVGTLHDPVTHAIPFVRQRTAERGGWSYGVSRFGLKAAPAYVAATSSASFAALISRAVLRALRRNGSSVSFDRVIIAPKVSRWRPKCTAAPTAQSDRNLSPLKVSQKREFLHLRLETFGRFSPKLPILRAWRLVVHTQICRKLQGFRAEIGRNPRSSEWVAGAAGIELSGVGLRTQLP
jgi:hypothetical protein